MRLPFAYPAHPARADSEDATLVKTLANSLSLTGPVTLTSTILSNPVPANTVAAPVTRPAAASSDGSSSSSRATLPTITVTQTVPVETSSSASVGGTPSSQTAVATPSSESLSSSIPVTSSSTPLSSASITSAPSSTPTQTSEAVSTTPASTLGGIAPPSVSSTPSTTASLSPSGFANAAANSSAAAPTVSASSDTSNTSGIKAQGVGAASSSSVPVAAIVVPILFVALLLLGVVAFLVRRRAVKNRMRKRNTWGAGKYQTPDFRDTERAYEAARRANVAPYFEEVVPPMAPAPPQMSYNNNPPPVAAPSAYNFAPALASGGSAVIAPISVAAAQGGLVPTFTSSISAGPTALVRYTFIPTLPDELHISSGERVRILTEYDDGWALCENVAGEQGMVPIECLDRGNGGGGLMVPPSPVGSYRSKRASSLTAGSGIRPAGQQGRYY